MVVHGGGGWTLKHVEETAKGDASDDDLGVKGGIAGKLASVVEVGKLVGVEGGA